MSKHEHFQQIDSSNQEKLQLHEITFSFTRSRQLMSANSTNSGQEKCKLSIIVCNEIIFRVFRKIQTLSQFEK